jgi:hypothetical protein
MDAEPHSGSPEYDATKWQVEKGAWDHEHCDLCGENIPAMTLCWVTKYDPYILLCDACHAKVAADESPTSFGTTTNP